MSETVIRAENLGKRYRVEEVQRYLTLRDILANTLTRLRHRNRGSRSPEYLWALKHVNLEISQGEIVGLIGRNGAGKTTLLRILSRITRPTMGYAEIRGRVGSLLEVGTGFHPELTGTENVYLSGAVLGMRRSEIVRKFDEIISFAGVERFVSMPLKHFSTGMQMRLAFAVAANLDPEILMVDEVLAVGDAEFQKKCLGKMDEATKSGRTIVFVTHQMNQVRRLCQRCIWIDGGQVRLSGPVRDVVGAYEASFTSLASIKAADRVSATRFMNWRIVEPRSDAPNVLDGFGRVEFESVLTLKNEIRGGHHGIALFNSDNQLIWATSVSNLTLPTGIHALRFKLPSLQIRPGVYRWHVSIWDTNRCLDQWTCVPDMIVATKPVTHAHEQWQGLLNTPWEFQLEKLGD